MNNIIKIKQEFFLFAETVHAFLLQDWKMHKQGIIYKKKQHKYKFVCILMKKMFQIKQKIEEEENIEEMLEELKKIEKILKNKDIEIIDQIEEKGRTLEKDFIINAWCISNRYCKNLILDIEGANKEEWLIKNIEELTLYLALKTYERKRREMKEKKEIRIIKEKAMTQRLKKNKNK